MAIKMIRIKKQKEDINRRRAFEMALDKAKFQAVVADHAEQVLQNWCLMEYCLCYRHDLAETYEHWRTELETQLNTIARKLVKGDKLKWTKQVMINEEEFNHEENVFNACRVKFRHENRGGLGITDKEQHTVCSHCADEIYDIIECMASQDITVYTDSRFQPMETLK